jgi:hypothetical protein
MNKYFGEPTLHGTKISTPVGLKCIWCKETFVEKDNGVAIPHISDSNENNEFILDGCGLYHENCFKRTIIGSVGHQRKQCNCYGGNLEDPESMTLREAATAAVEEWMSNLTDPKQKIK